MTTHSDVLILGGGVCGMTAAVYAARANLSVRIVEREVCGGLVNWTHVVENVPSYTSIHGMELMARCREHVESLGVAIEEVDEAVGVSLEGESKGLATAGGGFTGDALIIASGRRPVPLPVETDFPNVHYCSVCDGAAYKGKDALIIGGGNSAFDECLYLAGLGVRSLHIVEIAPACMAARATQERVGRLPGVRISVETRLDALESLPGGRGRAVLRDMRTGAVAEEEIDGVFCFTGQSPNTDLFAGKLELENGYIVTDENMATSIPGVFAAGDVRVKKYRQIVTAMSDGAIAALEAERYLRALRQEARS